MSGPRPQHAGSGGNGGGELTDGQPGQGQGGPTPQYSVDGRWWWDGQRWAPVQQAPAAHASQSRHFTPGRWLYAVAVLFLVAGAVLFVVLLAAFPVVPPPIAHMIAPGRTAITAPQAGTYTIDYEYQAVLDGRTYNTSPNFPSMELTLVSATSGARVPIRPASADLQYQVGSTVGESIEEFTVDRPGRYVLACRYTSGQTGPDIVLAISRGSPTIDVFAIFGSMGSIGLMIAGLIIGIVTFIWRTVSKDRARVG